MMKVTTIGIIGGGQLARMLTLAAKPLGLDVVVLDAGENGPAVQVGARQIKGDLYDAAAIAKLAKASDVVTIEIEHLNVEALQAIEAAGTPVHPAPATIAMIQDKYQQKVTLHKQGFPTAEFAELDSLEVAREVLAHYGGVMIVKTRHGAYDGRGNMVVQSEDELAAAWQKFAGQKLYAEKLVDFTKELAVMVARDTQGDVLTYPVVETVHERNICVEVRAPAAIDDNVRQETENLAREVAEKVLKGAGVFGIEMFLAANGDVLVNEIAPRVHNSGHYTMDACTTGQFEQHIRAVARLPLGLVAMHSPAAAMINILGERDGPTDVQGLEKALAIDGVHVHLYGKSPTKVDRKMGHINALAATLEQAKIRAHTAREKMEI